MVTSVMTSAPANIAPSKQISNSSFNPKDKPVQVRISNISAAKSVADVVKTSLGPRGMDKMIQNAKGEIIVTNDGATILKNLQVLHPAARMMVELSEAQDDAVGDGTTSVVVIAGALLSAAEKALEKNIHPTTISESFLLAIEKASEYIEAMGQAVDVTNKDSLVKCAVTSLSSKVVSTSGLHIAGIAAQAIQNINTGKGNVDISEIRVIPRIGGTVEDMRLLDGLVLRQSVQKNANGPVRIEKASIAMVQFQISSAKDRYGK